MSFYATSRVMWEIARDRDLAAEFQADPDNVLAGRDLTDDERTALRGADIRGLFQMGIHPFVLNHFALRLAGGVSMEFMKGYVGKLQGLSIVTSSTIA